MATNKKPVRGAKTTTRNAKAPAKKVVAKKVVAKKVVRKAPAKVQRAPKAVAAGVLSLSIIKATSYDKIKIVADVGYIADGVHIPFSTVVAVVGAVIYHRVQITLGEISSLANAKGRTAITLADDTKVLVFDASAISISAEAGEASAASSEDDESDDESDDEDESDADEDDESDDESDEDGDDEEDEEDDESDDEDEDGDDEEDEEDEPAPRKKAGKKVVKKGKKKPVDEDEDDEDSEDEDGDDEDEDDLNF